MLEVLDDHRPVFTGGENLPEVAVLHKVFTPAYPVTAIILTRYDDLALVGCGRIMQGDTPLIFHYLALDNGLNLCAPI